MVFDPLLNVSCIASIKKMVLMTEQNVNAVREWHGSYWLRYIRQSNNEAPNMKSGFPEADPLKQISCVDRFRGIASGGSLQDNEAT